MARMILLASVLLLGGAQGIIVSAYGSSAASVEIKVTPLITQGRIAASFVATGAFTAESRDIVKSGLPLTFTYQVELRRPSNIWFDKTLGSATLSATTKFDNLTSLYQVTKLQDGRVFWSKSTSKEEEMQTWTTELEDVAVKPSEQLESNVEYYIQVRLQIRPHQHTPLWPFGRDDGSGRADFTFIK